MLAQLRAAVLVVVRWAVAAAAIGHPAAPHGLRAAAATVIVQAKGMRHTGTTWSTKPRAVMHGFSRLKLIMMQMLWLLGSCFPRRAQVRERLLPLPLQASCASAPAAAAAAAAPLARA